jgi:type IV secretion system protein VirB6
MACPAVLSGSQFLVQALSHLDCQAQTLGSFGFQSLAQAGSPAGLALSALLTLFIAIYGIRLLFTSSIGSSDLVNAVLKVGIVLTIAVSWPAWRTIAYDTVFYGPAEIAASLTPSTLPSSNAGFAQRLQGVDSGIAALTASGTGRLTGQLTEEETTFRTIALTDEAGLGWSRPLYLATTIGSLAVLRVTGGLLLALAPLIAGLLLFDFSRGIFAGWIRGLVLTAVGSLGLTVLLSVQLALMEPWLADVLNRRGLGYATPTAPTELLALVLAFAIAAAGLLFILAKVAFQNSWSLHLPALSGLTQQTTVGQLARSGTAHTAEIPVHSRALAISENLAGQMRREEAQLGGMDRVRRITMQPTMATATGPGEQTVRAEPLGNSYRRGVRRDMQSQRRRDDRR